MLAIAVDLKRRAAEGIVTSLAPHVSQLRMNRLHGGGAKDVTIPSAALLKKITTDRTCEPLI